MNKLIQDFKTNAELANAKIQIIKKTELLDTISHIIKDEEFVITSFKDKSQFENLTSLSNIISEPNFTDLHNIKVCLTDSSYGISKTGSIVIDNDFGYNAYLSMLSFKHIVILNSNNILEKPKEVFIKNDLKKTTSFSIISGPSATADMGEIVIGVHGPELLNIIIVNEDE